MRHLKLISISFAVALFTGCASTKNSPNISDAVEPQPCSFPGTDEEAPDWVCTGHIDKYKTGMGRYMLTQHNHNLAFEIAQLRARADLAHKLQTEIQSLKKDYQSSALTSSGEASDNFNSSTRSSEVDILLEGTRVLTSLTGPNNWLYVLVGQDETLIDKELDRIVSNSYLNPEAQHLKELADQEINKLKTKNSQ